MALPLLIHIRQREVNYYEVVYSICFKRVQTFCPTNVVPLPHFSPLLYLAPKYVWRLHHHPTFTSLEPTCSHCSPPQPSLLLIILDQVTDDVLSCSDDVLW